MKKLLEMLYNTILTQRVVHEFCSSLVACLHVVVSSQISVLDVCMIRICSHHTYTVPTPYLVACIHELYFASRDSCPMIDPNVDRNLDAHEACRSHVCSRVRFPVVIASSIV